MSVDPVSQPGLLYDLLAQAAQRRPYLTALALMSPGGQLWASILPDGVEAESIAAMAAPAALLGRRIALEQLEGDMRQVYVEGEGGYVILRAIGKEAILLTVASGDSNLALVLHDVGQLQDHVADLIGATPAEVGEWTAAAPAIERLRRLTSEGRVPGVPARERLANLRDKLASLDLGYFPERVAAIRERLDQARTQAQLGSIEEIETDMLALERDVMAQVMPAAPVPAEPPASVEVRPAVPVEVPAPPPAPPAQAPAKKEPPEPRGSFIRRALRWLASMIASED